MNISAASQAKVKIAAHPGWVFTPSDFQEIKGKKAAVERALSRLAVTGDIKRLRKGLYYYPTVSPLVGEMPPTADAIVNALAREKGAQLLPAGAMAAHRLGLTTQVPMQLVYYTDRSSCEETLGKLLTKLKKVPPNKLSGAGQTAGVVLSALEYLGKQEGATKTVIERVASTLSSKDIAPLAKAAACRAVWVRRLVEHVIATWRQSDENILTA